jgi:lysophospholipase L1-like esterase
MKALCRKENNNADAGINVKPVFRVLIFIIIFSGKLNFARAVILGGDSIPQPINLLESQGRMNRIYNTTGLATIRNKVRKTDSTFIVIKVLHIGDSHIKAGFFSETFIDKMNAWYGQTLNRNIFFSAQSFCKTGTKYSDYAELAELDQQLLSDKPDLVIISLGTNDAFSGSSKKNFYDKVNHLVSKIKTLSPASALLLTTPSDALKKNKVTGMFEALPDLQYVVSVIIQYAKDHQLAYWNLHQVMGGNYSVNTWFAKKLAAPDRIHFTQKGYTVIGEWLFEAVKNCL